MMKTRAGSRRYSLGANCPVCRGRTWMPAAHRTFKVYVRLNEHTGAAFRDRLRCDGCGLIVARKMKGR